MNAAQFAARYLKEQGVKRVFGIPGLETLNLQAALAAEGLEFVPTHHESAAVFMASYSGQLTGIPGVALATRGPGAANLFGGVAEAWIDRQPVIAISADTDPQRKPTNTHQDLDLMDIYRPVTKVVGEVTAANVQSLLPLAFEAARRGRPGPCFLAFPNAEAGREIPAERETARNEVREARSQGGVSFEEALRLVREAQRPVIYWGIGVEYSRSQQAARRFAEHLDAPVILTPKAKGHFPASHPLYCGVLHSYGDQPLKDLVEQADLVVALGIDGTEFLRQWTHQPLVLSLASAGADERCFPRRVWHEADLGATLAGMVAALEPRRDGGARRAGEARQAVRALLDPARASGEIGGIFPQEVLRELRALVPPETVATCDIGAHKLVTCQLWDVDLPGTFFTSNGMSAMGSALPMAIGIAYERPAAPTICFAGDGGLLAYTGEFETLRRSGRPVLIVAWVDAGYSIIKLGQEYRQAPPNGVDFTRPDFVALARGFGLWAERIERREAIRPTLERALAVGGPALVEVPVDYNVYRGMDF